MLLYNLNQCLFRHSKGRESRVIKCSCHLLVKYLLSPLPLTDTEAVRWESEEVIVEQIHTINLSLDGANLESGGRWCSYGQDFQSNITWLFELLLVIDTEKGFRGRKLYYHAANRITCETRVARSRTIRSVHLVFQKMQQP